MSDMGLPIIKLSIFYIILCTYYQFNNLGYYQGVLINYKSLSFTNSLIIPCLCPLIIFIPFYYTYLQINSQLLPMNHQRSTLCTTILLVTLLALAIAEDNVFLAGHNYGYNINSVYGINNVGTNFYPSNPPVNTLGVQQFVPFINGNVPNNHWSPYVSPIQTGTFQFTNNAYRVQNQVYNPFPGGLVQGFQQLPSQAVGITGLQGVIDYPTIHPIPAPASVPTSGITAPVLEFVPSNVQQVIFPGTPVANNLLNGPYSWIVNPQSGIPLTNPPVYEKNNHDGGNNPQSGVVFNGFPTTSAQIGAQYKDGPTVAPIQYIPATRNPSVSLYPTGNAQTDPIYTTGSTLGYYPTYLPLVSNLGLGISSYSLVNPQPSVGPHYNLRTDCHGC